MKQRRLFIAINLPAYVKSKFKEYQNKWYNLNVRWTKPENLHITLVFIGYVGDDEMLSICDIAKEIGKNHDPFSIRFNKILFGPPNKPPRMIWAEGEISRKFADLQNDLERKIFHFSGAFGRQDARVFKPHITLARIRQNIERDLQKIPDIEENINLEFSVNSIEVMESRLGKGGAEYTILESMDLGQQDF